MLDRTIDLFHELNPSFVLTHALEGPEHAIQPTFLRYVWEPAGYRIEVANAGARQILAPDWQTVTWTETGH